MKGILIEARRRERSIERNGWVLYILFAGFILSLYFTLYIEVFRPLFVSV